jgi:hypothetical protein
VYGARLDVHPEHLTGARVDPGSLALLVGVLGDGVSS